MGRNLGPLNIKDSYEGLVQISGSQLTDGSGSLISSLEVTASDATTAVSASFATSASYAVTASFAENAGTPTLQQVTDEGNTSTNNIIVVNSQNRTYGAASITSNTAGGTYSISGGTVDAALALSGNGGTDNVIRVNPAFGVEITGSTAFQDEITIDSTALKTLVTKGGVEISSSTAPTLEIQSTTASLDPSILFQSGSTYVGFVAGTSTALEIGDLANNRVKVSGSSLEIDVALTASGLNYPTADGTVGQVLTTDGAGNLTLEDAAGGDAFPYTGSAQITGSLGVTGSVSIQSGSFINNDSSVDYGPASRNTVFGSAAGRQLSGGYNVTLGGNYFADSDGAGSGITTGTNNVVVGNAAAAGAGSAGISENVIVGSLAGYQNTKSENVIIGYGVNQGGNGSGQSVLVGKWAGYNITGNQNVCLGWKTGFSVTSGQNNIFIGPNVQGQGGSSFTNSSYLAIGSDTAAADNLLYGNHESGGSSRFLQVLGDLRVTGSEDILGKLTIDGTSETTVISASLQSGESFELTNNSNGATLLSGRSNSVLHLGTVSDTDMITAGRNGSVGMFGDAFEPGTPISFGTSRVEFITDLEITGSIRNNPDAITPASNTGSMDCSASNFFTMTLGNAVDTRLEASNIQPGQTINLKLTNNATAAGTISFGPEFEFEGGTPFTVTAATDAVDVMTFISFDGTSLQATGLKNFS